MTSELDRLKALAWTLGYRFEVDLDGTERLIRPDGSVALIAQMRVCLCGVVTGGSMSVNPKCPQHGGAPR